jgi:hypothetical protein
MVVDKSAHIFLKHGAAKVDQQTERQTRQTKVSDHLFRVDGGNVVNRLDFNDKLIVHQNVNSKGIWDDDAPMRDIDGALSINSDALYPEFFGKDQFVGGFEEAGSEIAMDVKAQIDDNGGKLFQCRHHIPFASSRLRVFARTRHEINDAHRKAF